MAVPWSTWLGDRASAGVTWQAPQATGCDSPCVAPRCDVCVPTRTGSAALPQVALGGAPVWLSTPPWHMVQLVVQAAPWQAAQAMLVVPPRPSRAAPWQGWQLARPALAAGAWKPALAGSIQLASWCGAAPQGWHWAQAMPALAYWAWPPVGAQVSGAAVAAAARDVASPGAAGDPPLPDPEHADSSSASGATSAARIFRPGVMVLSLDRRPRRPSAIRWREMGGGHDRSPSMHAQVDVFLRCTPEGPPRPENRSVADARARLP